MKKLKGNRSYGAHDNVSSEEQMYTRLTAVSSKLIRPWDKNYKGKWLSLQKRLRMVIVLGVATMITTLSPSSHLSLFLSVSLSEIKKKNNNMYVYVTEI